MSERTTDAVRTLVLEDDAADVELVRAMLTHAGLAVSFVVVDSRESFCAALREHEFELILADYMLPSFDGLSALKLAREIVPEVPFIIVSAVCVPYTSRSCERACTTRRIRTLKPGR